MNSSHFLNQVNHFIILNIIGDDKNKQLLFKNLRYISQWDQITPIDIQNVVNLSLTGIDPHPIISYLCRESLSLSNFTKESVESLISKLLDPYKKFTKLGSIPRRHYSFNNKISLKFSDSRTSVSKGEMTREEILDISDKWLKKFSDFL